MGFNSGLKHEDAERPVAVRFYFIASIVNRRRHVVDKRHHIPKEFHHAPHAHIFKSAYTEHGIDRAVNKPFADSFTHLVF